MQVSSCWGLPLAASQRRCEDCGRERLRGDVTSLYISWNPMQRPTSAVADAPLKAGFSSRSSRTYCVVSRFLSPHYLLPSPFLRSSELSPLGSGVRPQQHRHCRLAIKFPFRKCDPVGDPVVSSCASLPAPSSSRVFPRPTLRASPSPHPVAFTVAPCPYCPAV